MAENMRTKNGMCGVVMDVKKYGPDCKFYTPDNHSSCIHASWGRPVLCLSSSAEKDSQSAPSAQPEGGADDE